MDAGGEFVDEKFSIGEFEEFDAEEADQFELIGNLGSKGEGCCGGGGGSASGEDGAFQNTSLVLVLERRKRHRKTGGLAGDEDRKFTDKRNVLLEDSTGNVDLGPGLLGVGGGVEGQLSFAIVAKGGGFEPGFARKSGEGGSKIIGGGDNFEARAGEVILLKKFAFPFAVLAEVKDFRVRKDGSDRSDLAKRLDGDIFEFVGNYVAGLGQAAERFGIIEWSGEGDIGDRGSGASEFRVENGDAVTHPTSGQGEHAPELTPADDADGFTWRNHGKC